MRGRHRWNKETKEWEIKYRPYRNYWIVLLLSVNPRIFALPMPKVVPSRIKAQYELEDDYQKTLQMSKAEEFMAASQPKTDYHSITKVY